MLTFIFIYNDRDPCLIPFTLFKDTQQRLIQKKSWAHQFFKKHNTNILKAFKSKLPSPQNDTYCDNDNKMV